MVELTIPNEWLKVSISDLADVDLGKTPKKIDYLSVGDYKVVKFRDVDYSGIDWSIDKDGFVSDKTIGDLRELKHHDVLITASAHSSEHIGRKICFVTKLPKDYKKIYFCGELLGIRANDNVLSPKYCFYYFLSHAGYKEIQSHVKGVHLTSGQARNMSIPFTSLPEQDRIIEIVEELFSDLDNAIENLKKAQEQVEIYRLSVLKEGFSGGLTKDWRKKHQDVKNGKEILADIIRQTKQPSIDLEDATVIPEKWSYTSIVNLVAQEKNSLKRGPFGSSIKKSFFVPSGYKVYEQQNAIKNDCALGRYCINKPKYEELEQFAIYSGDFIVSCAGTIGCIAEVPEGAEPGVINQALLKIKVNTDILDKKFFLYQFKLYVERFMRAKSRGSAMKNMSSVKELKQIPFVFTAIEEQRQVISEIESRFSVCDKLGEAIESSLNQAESLRQSILKQAFEGKLTEEWRKEHKDLISGVNSAEALLKKIKAEKEALQAKSKGKKKHD